MPQLSPLLNKFYSAWEISPTAYNLGFYYTLEDKSQVVQLLNAVSRLVSSNAYLRQTFKRNGKNVSSEFHDELAPEVTYRNIQDVDELNQFINHQVVHNLNTQSAIKITVIENKHIVMFNIHHILLDGKGLDIFIQQLNLALADKALPPVTADGYIKQVKNSAKQLVSFTPENFSDYITRIENSSATYSGVNYLPSATSCRYNATMPQTLYDKITTAANKYRLSHFNLMLLLWSTFECKLFNRNATFISYPVNLRQDADLAGCFINNVIIPFSYSKQDTLATLSHSMQQQLPLYKDLSVIDVTEIISSLNLNNNIGHFADSAMAKVEALHIQGKTFAAHALAQLSGYAYGLSYRELDKQYHFSFECYAECFATELRSSMLERLFNFMDTVLNKTEQTLASFNILLPTEAEKLLLEFNQTYANYPRNSTIQDLFLQQVLQTPDNTAIVYNQTRLSYRELNERANQLAHYLIDSCQVKQDDLVGLCLERSEIMLIAILGVLKAGATYVPVDPHAPRDRVGFILEDTKIRITLCDKSCLPILKNTVATHKDIQADIRFIELNGLSDVLATLAIAEPLIHSTEHTLAYIIYTSGTTGKPKGVMLEHQSVINTLTYMRKIYDFSKGNKVTAFTSYVFDVSVSEFFVSLLNGAELHIFSDEVKTDPNLISKYILNNKINYVYLPPVMLATLPKIDYPSLYGLIYAGEPCDPITGHYWSTHKCLFNYYGPTETTIYSTGKQVENGDTYLIGKPIANTIAYVLDENLQLLPVGVSGELHLGGEGLARGYLHRADLTAEKFISNPFQTTADKQQHRNAQMYKTGDLVRWTSDGNIEYLGRNDFQVKIRGYRIELGDIEAVLSSFPEITQCVVLPKEQIDNNGNRHKYLAAYYVAKQKLSETDILAYMAEKLPEYMLPAGLIYLAALPQTINGKLDRKALPDLELGSDNSNYVAPQNETENLLCKAYADTLGVTKVGCKSSFFKLGGNSISAIKLVSQLNTLKLPFKFNVMDILKYNNIESLLAHKAQDSANSKETITNHIFANFMQIVEQYPNQTAVIAEGSRYTYTDLFEYSTTLAAQLATQVKPGEKIGVIYSRNCELIAIIFAIFRIGACYVPIDPHYSKDEIKFISNEANIKVVIGQPKFQYVLPEKIKFLTFDGLISYTVAKAQDNLTVPISLNDLACQVYILDEQGKLSAAAVPHGRVLAILEHCADLEISFLAGDTWVMHHKYASNIALWEILGAILTGGTLHIVSKEIATNTSLLYQYISANHINNLLIKPATFNRLTELMQAQALPKLHNVLITGEMPEDVDYAIWATALAQSETKLIDLTDVVGVVEYLPAAQLQQLDPHSNDNLIDWLRQQNTPGVAHNKFAATYNQSALYFTAMTQGTPTYNINYRFKFNRRIAATDFELALKQLLNGFEELRTTLVYKDGVLEQKILATPDTIIEIINCADADKEDVSRTLAMHEFDFSSYLFKFSVLETELDSYLFMCIHHTIFDGMSCSIFKNQLLKLLQHKKIVKPANSYLDFGQYQHKLLSDTSYTAKVQQFWQNNLAVDSNLQLRFADVKAHRFTPSNNQYKVLLESKLVDKIDALGNKFNISPYIIYLLSYGTLLHIYTNEMKFAVGVPYANRPDKFVDTMGYFVNTLPLAFDFSNQASLSQALDKFYQQHLNCLEYQDYPLSLILKNGGFSNMNTFFAYQRGFNDEISQYGNLEAEGTTIHNNTAKFDLFLEVRDHPANQVELTLEFNQKLLSPAFVQTFMSYYEFLLEFLSQHLESNPEQGFADFLIELKNTSTVELEGPLMPIEPMDLISLFKQSVVKHPDQTAIFDDSRELNYLQLDRESDIIARKLILAYQDTQQKCVGLYFRRDISMVVYIIATLKAGLAYIPLNEEFPAKRIELIKEVAQLSLILTNIDDIPQYLHINQFNQMYQDNTNITLPSPEHLANATGYIMFTSGTTGQPKGVSLGQKSLANRIIWMRDKYKLKPDNTMFMKTPFNFDVSCGEIFLPLCSGAKLFISHHQAHKNLDYILDKVAALKISHIYFVPTMLNIFLQYVQHIGKYDKQHFSNLQIIYCSGEALNQALVDECYTIFPEIKIYNQYGPTEAGEVSDYLCKANDDYQIVPIGMPINNTSFFIVDKNNHKVLQGMPGELLISGDCLAEGYYNQSLLTKQKFIEHTDLSPRVYKTGDLVVLDHQDNLCFLERIDNQTKINGIRIELGEVEHALLNQESISQAFVNILKEQDRPDKLIAFYVTKNKQKLEEDYLRNALNEYLPQYMLPTNYFHLETIPTNINGKIDRALCMDMFKSSSTAQSVNSLDIQQFNPEEQQIIQIWCNLLKRSLNSVSLSDNFLLTGGSSLLMSKLILELEKQMQFSLNMFEIINCPTLENLIALFNNESDVNNSSVDLMYSDIQQCIKNYKPALTLEANPQVQTILITGANGFIGRNTLAECIKQYPKAKILTLNRKPSSNSDTNVQHVSGNLSEANLGLSPEDYADICNNVDVIIHIAAAVNHIFAYAQHRVENVLATSDLIKIALTGRPKQIIFISTTGSSAHDITKIDQNELIQIEGIGGYLESKIIAEKIIYHAVANYGLAAQILRLGYVGPNVETLDINFGNNHLYALFKSFVYKQCAPDWESEFECLPVNEVAQQILNTMKDRTLPLIATVANSVVISWQDVFSMVEVHSGVKLKRIPHKDWLENIVKAADPEQENYLYKLIPLYNINGSTDEATADFKLNGDVVTTIDYPQIIQSYIQAVSKFA